MDAQCINADLKHWEVTLDAGEVREVWGAASAEEAIAAFQQAAATDTDAPSAPRSVSPRQARAALNAAGLRDAVEAAVASAPRDIRDAWEYGLAVERNSPFIAAMAGVLQLTDADVDALFAAAAEA